MSQRGGLPAVGAVLGDRYVIRSVLGRGGMGAVYVAFDGQRGEEVALKVLLATIGLDEVALARFEREANAVARVDQHAAIVRVRDFGRSGSTSYVVMDLVRGSDLDAVLRERGPLAVDEALELTEAIARAIQHCHERGVLHRDLKPANVLIREDGAPFVTDFGIALDLEAERLTKTGDLIGTPVFMSPEQADGNPSNIDARTDVYGLGAILYNLIAGRPPFEGPNAISILSKVFTEQPPPLRAHRPEVPADVDVICQMAMAKEPRRRYRTAAALADDIARLRRGEPILARPPTGRELFFWRLRRLEPRALATAIVPTLVLLGALFGTALWAGYRHQQATEPRDRLAAQLDRLAAVVAREHPLGDGEGASLQARVKELHGACAEFLGQDVAGDVSFRERTDALATLVESLGEVNHASPPTVRLEELLTEEPERRVHLQIVVRRAAFRAGLGHRGGLPTYERAPPNADEEDLLMNALRLIEWRSPDPPAYDAEAVDQARALLRAARSGSTRASQAAKHASAKLEETARLIEEHRRAVTEFLDTQRPRLAVNLDALRDARIDATLAGPLSALFRAAIVPFKRQQVLASLQGTLRRLRDPARSFTTARPYDRLRWLLIAIERVQQSAPRAPVADANRLAVQTVAAISARAREESTDEAVDAWTRLIEVVPAHLWTGDEKELAQVYQTLHYALARVLEDKRRRSLRLLLILPLFHQSPGVGLLRHQIQAFVADKAFERHLLGNAPAGEVRRTGNAYLAWADCLESLRDNVDLEDPEHYEPLIELYAKALGDELSAADRLRLGLDPRRTQVELQRPLTQVWRGYGRWRLVRFLTSRLGDRSPEERTPRAWKALLDEYRLLHDHPEWFTDGGTCLGSDHWIVCTTELGDTSRAYRDVLRSRSELPPERERELTDEVLRALGAAAGAVWKLVELNADGSPEAMRELGIRHEGNLFGTYGISDQERNVERLLMRCVRDQGYLHRERGEADTAIAIYRATSSRLREIGLRTPLSLRVELAWSLDEAGQSDAAEARAREVVAEAAAGLKTHRRYRFESEFESGNRLLATLCLKRGDVAGARAAYEAARAEDCAQDDSPQWTWILQQLEQGE